MSDNRFEILANLTAGSVIVTDRSTEDQFGNPYEFEISGDDLDDLSLAIKVIGDMQRQKMGGCE